MRAEDLTTDQLARVVAEMGAAGHSQGEIIEALETTGSKLRYRLALGGYLWTTESRVKIAHTREDVLALDQVSEAAMAGATA